MSRRRIELALALVAVAAVYGCAAQEDDTATPPDNTEDELIEVTSRSALPVLQTFIVATLVVPTQVAAKLGLAGI